MPEPKELAPIDEPSAWVVRFAELVPKASDVLDIACGGGRHSKFFLSRGHGVTAVDRDLSRLSLAQDTPGFSALEADLEDADHPLFDGGPLEGRQFGAVVVTNYLYRPLFPSIIASLQPGGVLIYETFALGNERFGRPRNPAHLLKEAELLDAVRGRLAVIAYEDIERPAPKRAKIQRICATLSRP